MWKSCYMKRFLLFGLLALILVPELWAERKKVGLVLSGGGAKGMAHIGAIQILEKAGIPIDYVVGTSMGAIVGGLYAIGYSADTLETLVRDQNWTFLLGDKVKRRDLTFAVKETSERYALSFYYGKDRESRFPAGFIKGQNVYNLFSDLTIGYHDSLDFSKLPIPFACVAANIVDGKEIVLKSGNLVQSMRASMAIPGAFTPVKLDSMVLVDGGIVNNYPADVARAMGAEIIIGVDVQSDLMTAEKLNSVPGIVAQLVNLLCLSKYEENSKLTNLMIKPDVQGYSAASFSADAIDTLIRHGREAAALKWNDLQELKEQIGLEQNDAAEMVKPGIVKDTFYLRHIYVKGVKDKDIAWLRKTIKLKENSGITTTDLHKTVASLYGSQIFSSVTYRLLGGPEYDLELTLTQNPMNSLNLGFRFDSEEMAAILLNTTLNHKALRGSRLSLTGRLSKNPYIRLDYSLEQPFFRRFGLAYMFRYNDFNVYSKGDKINNVTYRYHLGELSLTDIYLRSFKFQLGLRYEYYDYDSFIFRNDDFVRDVRSEGYVSAYALAHLETFDQRYYPRKGMSFKAEYSYYVDKFTADRKQFSALSADFTGVIRLANRTHLIPSAYGRVLMGHDIPYPYLNYMGSNMTGRYAPQQLKFTGINNTEIFNNSLLVGRMELRQRMGSKHDGSLIVNYGLQEDNFFDILGGQGMWGGGAGYSYDSKIGPIAFTLGISDWTDKVGVYFNLGFNF